MVLVQTYGTIHILQLDMDGKLLTALIIYHFMVRLVGQIKQVA